MSALPKEVLSFLKDLKKNNHKDWMQENKKQYQANEKVLKKLYADLEAGLNVDDQIEKLKVFRINRDIRFSKDKTPYNLHYTAFISRGGKKDKSIPGFFVRFSPEMVGIMGGCFAPDKEQLLKIRTKIKEDPKTFRKLIEEQQFTEHFGELNKEVKNLLLSVIALLCFTFVSQKRLARFKMHHLNFV